MLLHLQEGFAKITVMETFLQKSWYKSNIYFFNTGIFCSPTTFLSSLHSLTASLAVLKLLLLCIAIELQ